MGHGPEHRWQSYSLPRLLTMSVSPLALPRPHVLHRGMARGERQAVKLANQRHLQPYLGTYINRSAAGLLGCFGSFLLSGYVLASATLVVATGLTMLTVLVHLTALLFWKQHLDNRFGPVEPPE